MAPRPDPVLIRLGYIPLRSRNTTVNNPPILVVSAAAYGRELREKENRK